MIFTGFVDAYNLLRKMDSHWISLRKQLCFPKSKLGFHDCSELWGLKILKMEMFKCPLKHPFWVHLAQFAMKVQLHGAENTYFASSQELLGAALKPVILETDKLPLFTGSKFTKPSLWMCTRKMEGLLLLVFPNRCFASVTQYNKTAK